MVFLLLVSAVLFGERWVEHRRLCGWKERMAARGEVFDASKVWPRPSTEGTAFSNQLQRVTGQLPPGLSHYAGFISGIVVQEPGIARRGSQEPTPVLYPARGGTNSWEDLALNVRQAQPTLLALRTLLREPPGGTGNDIRFSLEKLNLPNYVNIRKAAQALQAAAISELHRGNLEAAKDDLVALAAITRVYAEDPNLVNYMIRMAVLGLSIEPAWDALQAKGWTERQLVELQEAFQCEPLLAQMPRTLEAERATRLYQLDWFASHSYLAWVRRLQPIYEPLYESMGQQRTNDSAQVLVTRYFRACVFHPLWRFAWADAEQLEYLENTQRELEVVRAAVQSGSARELSKRLAAVRQGYRPPLAGWRFYLVIPWMDQASECFGLFRDKHEYPYPNFTRAFAVSMKNLTLGQMLTAAIALQRYQTHYGKPAATLAALVPEFLPKMPRDFMDGQPLRYKLQSDGSYRLYSIAEDAEDDQGSSVPNSDTTQPQSVWNGRDWVWPRAVAEGH